MNIISSNALLKELVGKQENTVARINLAWCKNETELIDKIRVLSAADYPIVLDFPRGRRKPPLTNFDLKTIYVLLQVFPKIQYFALSNVESPDDLKPIRQEFKNRKIKTRLLPKIETVKAFENLKGIATYADDIWMVDHTDLYADLSKTDQGAELPKYLERLSIFCKQYRIKLFREQGVIFGLAT